MSFVLDASVTLSWFFRDEENAYTNMARERLATEGAIAPAIWPFELANALVVAERRRRIDEGEAAFIARALTRLPVELEEVLLERAVGAVRRLAVRGAVSAYDAAYLDLALRRNFAIATVDRRLQDAATQLGLDVLA